MTTRRSFLTGMLAGVAIATGLARTRLELVDEGPEPDLYFKGVPVWWDSTLENHGAIVNPETRRSLERLWQACVSGGSKPDYVLVVDDGTTDPLLKLRRF